MRDRGRPPSGLVEFKTDVVYAVRRDANAAGVRLRQLQDQEHRAGYAKGSERRHGDGRVAGFRVQPGRKKCMQVHMETKYRVGQDTASMPCNGIKIRFCQMAA